MSIIKDPALVSIDGAIIVAAMVSAGVFAMRWQILDKSSSESLSKLIIKILLPCLLFTSMINSFKTSAFGIFGMIFFFSTVHIFVGIFLGWLAGRVLKSNRDVRRLMMNCIGFQNTTAIPLVFAKALGSDGTTDDDEDFTENATNVVLIYTVFVTVYKWTVSYGMMKQVVRVEEKVGLNESVFDEKGEGNGCWWTIKKTMNAPLYATLAALVLALIPYVKEYVLSEPGSVLGDNLFLAMTVLGSAVSPLINIVLGCNLSAGYPPDATIKWSEIIAVVIGKLVLMPLFGLSIIEFAYAEGFIDRISALMLMIIYSAPTSLQLLMICTTHKNQVSNISKVYLVMYLVCALPLAFWTMMSLIILYD